MEWERFVKAITDSNELLRSYERKDNVIVIGSALGSYDFGRGEALIGRGAGWHGVPESERIAWRSSAPRQARSDWSGLATG